MITRNRYNLQGDKIPEVYFEATIPTSGWTKYLTYDYYWTGFVDIDETPELPQKVVVVFDGEEYECTRRDYDNEWVEYGAEYDDDEGHVFSDYPFSFWFYVKEGETPYYDAFVETKEKHTFVIKEV